MGGGYASMVIHQSYNPAENIGKQLSTSENTYGTYKNIWYHPENNWGPIIDNLVQFEEDFNTYTEMSDRVIISDQANS